MNNKDNFKKSLDNVHVSEELKKKTLEKMKQNSKKKVVPFKTISTITALAATFVIVFTGIKYYSPTTSQGPDVTIKPTQVAVQTNIKRFKNMEEYKAKLNEKVSYGGYKGDILVDDVLEESVTAQFETSDSKGFDVAINTTQSATNDESYSTTNTQVSGVDEADIVKTDGKYIYYVSNNTLYIVEAKELTEVTKKEFDPDTGFKMFSANIDDFMVQEIFIYEDTLTVIGRCRLNNTEKRNYYYYSYDTRVIEYDIKDRENIKELRTVDVAGTYKTSRLIKNNLYFVTNQNVNKTMDDDVIVPYMFDTAVGDDKIKTEVTDIAYVEKAKNTNVMMNVVGINLNKPEEPANTESVLGGADIIYASENNLYAAYNQTKTSAIFDVYARTTDIYKFALKDAKTEFKSKCTLDGYVKDQFSMDENEGNLRVAATIDRSSIFGDKEINKLYVLDEKLENIGELEGFAKDEKIYSVRFVGNVGYVVTFKQIDPLFIIDLSDPKKPEIKGELEMPGYSSYLHPYDETHIIGIGYNTKENSWGGVTNENLKMSMFDVSDLSNPKEMFKIDIGKKGSYANSDVTSNHKALFYNAKENLIGFPVSGTSVKDNRYIQEFPIMKIDLNKGFEVYGELIEETEGNKYNSTNKIERTLYIGDSLYTVTANKITKYNMKNLEKDKEIVIKEKSNNTRSPYIYDEY